MKIAVYGSLRRGQYNNMKSMGKKLSTEKIKGFEMYSLGPYPCVTKGNDEIIVEVYDVPLNVYEQINAMEIGAGYTKRYIQTTQGESVIWIFKNKPVHGKKLETGDWTRRV